MSAVYPEAQQVVYWLLSSMVVFITLYVIDLRLYHKWRPVWGAPGWVMMMFWAIGLFLTSVGAWFIQDESATVALPSGWVYTLTVLVVVLALMFIWPFMATMSNAYERLWLSWFSAGWLTAALALSIWVMVKSTVSYSVTGGWLIFPMVLILLYFVSVAFGSAYRMTYKEPRNISKDGIDDLEFNFADRQDSADRTERRDRERRNRNNSRRDTRGNRATPKRKNRGRGRRQFTDDVEF